MASPAPTPYKPAPYDTGSAGEFAGDPVIEVLHSYYHAGSDDYGTDGDYAMSIGGFFASVVILG